MQDATRNSRPFGGFSRVSTDSSSNRSIRVRVFVDFWNFQLSINSLDRNYKIDWEKLGPTVAEEALNIVDSTALLAYQGMNVYGSYDPSSRKDDGLRRWALNTLNRFPGVQVTMLERQRKQAGPVLPLLPRGDFELPRVREGHERHGRKGRGYAGSGRYGSVGVDRRLRSSSLAFLRP